MWLLGIPLLLSLVLDLQLLHADTRWTCRRPVVEVLVSPLVTSSHTRSLMLSWSLETVHPGDSVVLYRTDGSSAPIFTAKINSSSGWLDTGIQENRTVGAVGFTEECLGYWAALRSSHNSQVLASSCLGTAPRWMERQREALLNMSLKNLFLPGTHNSAAYLEMEEPFRETVVQKFVYNQDERALNQLIYGARVLDLRVGHYPSTPEVWWANHAVVRLHPLSHILDDVLLFVNMTREIVVLDFHRFPVGFSRDPRSVHQRLVQYLEEKLHGYLVPPSVGWGGSLDDVWQTGRRVILSYDYQGPVANQGVWPGVQHKWGNVRSLPALHQYLAGVIQKEYPYAWSAMAELTPSTVDVITGRLGGLRQMAHSVNGNVTEWFRGEWGATCNIVSVDFLRGTGLVRAALEWNLRRARRTLCDI